MLIGEEPREVARTFEIKLPMRLFVNKEDQKALNLNVYRNLHFFQNNLMKTQFHELMEPLLQDIPKMDQIMLHYRVNSRTKTRLDTMNVGSVVDKFFSDALVEHKIIVDDDYKHIVYISFDYGFIQPEEHVLVTIYEIKPKDNLPMRILLDEDDIQTALENYVETQGFKDASGVTISVDGDTITAEVNMGEAAPAKPKPKSRKGVGGRPAGSKNKVTPKEPETNVDEATTDDSADTGSGDSEPTTEGSADKAPKEVKKGSLFGDTPKGDSKSKNPSKESQEESSENTTEETGEVDNGKSVAEKPVKKSSIFDGV